MLIRLGQEYDYICGNNVFVSEVQFNSELDQFNSAPDQFNSAQDQFNSAQDHTRSVQ